MEGYSAPPDVAVEHSDSAVVVRGRHVAGRRSFVIVLLVATALIALLVGDRVDDIIPGATPPYIGTVRGRVPDWVVVVAVGLAVSVVASPWFAFEVRVTPTTVRMRWRYLGRTYAEQSVPASEVAFRINDDVDPDGGTFGAEGYCRVYRNREPLHLYVGSRKNAVALADLLTGTLADMIRRRDLGTPAEPA